MSRKAQGWRLFAWYAAVSAVPIVVLGLLLGHLHQVQTDRRGLDQAVSEADAISNAGIEPVLAGRDLSRPLTPTERDRLAAATKPLLEAGTVLRLRLRDVRGSIEFDAADPGAPPVITEDDEVVEAARGEVIRTLTSVNRDEVDSTRARALGPRAVEAYLPIHAGGTDRRVIGVLEIYLPYQPIATSIAAARRTMTLVLVVGLAGLWLALSVISWSTTGRLRRSAREQERLALHDPLTDLPNRALFVDRAQHAIETGRRSLAPVAVAIVDLDRFKELNDALGHRNGDQYLRHAATVLAANLRPGDTLARLGGDEFGLVLPSADGPTASAIVDRIRQALATDIEIAGVAVSSEASAGIACWPTDGDTIDDLLPCADLALHAAKQTQTATVVYTDGLARFSPERLALVSELRRAIEGDELVLHYQPQQELATGRVTAVEALVRWEHPTRGFLPPSEFLEVAESTGVIDQLTRWVLGQATRQVAAWREQGVDLRVAVNVSGRNLRDPALGAVVLGALAQADVPADRLEVEITETALVADPERAHATLTALREHGVRVAIDDFGQGYTSLSQLGRLPSTAVKIDRAFVAGMQGSAHSRAVVRAVVELGHAFGLEVVAEGVETEDQLEALRALDCDLAQGYLLARPLAPADLEAWLREHTPVG